MKLFVWTRRGWAVRYVDTTPVFVRKLSRSQGREAKGGRTRN